MKLLRTAVALRPQTHFDAPTLFSEGNMYSYVGTTDYQREIRDLEADGQTGIWAGAAFMFMTFVTMCFLALIFLLDDATSPMSLLSGVGAAMLAGGYGLVLLLLGRRSLARADRLLEQAIRELFESAWVPFFQDLPVRFDEDVQRQLFRQHVATQDGHVWTVSPNYLPSGRTLGSTLKRIS